MLTIAQKQQIKRTEQCFSEWLSFCLDKKESQEGENQLHPEPVVYEGKMNANDCTNLGISEVSVKRYFKKTYQCQSKGKPVPPGAPGDNGHLKGGSPL
jgi:hypothetical protein